MSGDLNELGELVLHGVRFDVRQVELAGVPGRNGQPLRRQIVVHPGSVVILPLLDEKTVVLIRNQRLAAGAAGQGMWELPAGTLEPPGEDPAECARRELIEETGYRAECWQPLTRFYPSPGILSEFMHAYAATGLTHVGQNLDDGERITVHPTPIDKLLAMIQSGQVCDAKTIAVTLFYLRFCRKGPGAGV